LTSKQKKEVWVRGVAYAPALHVRKFDKVEQRKGHLFHTAFDGDGYPALFGKCPEVMRVDNCTAWRPMSSVLKTILPRVIHPRDIKTWVIRVAGREWHYVCGISAREEDGLFTFQKIRRTSFFMYSEDVLGPCVQSATIMWEHVESWFENIRKLMRKSGRARSGSFAMPLTAVCIIN
jgi:hypothetical protein